MPDEITLAQIKEQIKQVGVQVRETREELLKEAGEHAKTLVNTSHADVRGELHEKLDKLNLDVVDLIEKRQTIEMAEEAHEELLARQDEILTRLDMHQSAAKNGDAPLSKRDELHVAAWREYAMTGGRSQEAQRQWLASYDEIERRTISEGTDPEGGFLVPGPLTMGIQKNILEVDVISQLATRVQITSGNSYTVPRMTDTGRGSAAEKTAEMGTPTAARPDWETVTRTIHPISVETPQISTDFLRDVANAGEILSEWAGEELGYKINYNYLLGDGVGQAEGILLNATVVANELTGSDITNHEISGADFYYALTSLKEAYEKRAVYLLNRTTLYHALKLREDLEDDGTGNRAGSFILPFSLRDGFPPTIGGLKYYLSPNMASSGTQNNKMLLCGDIRAAYWYARKEEIYFVADPYSNKPNWEYLWRIRDDGVVIKPEAVNYVKAG